MRIVRRVLDDITSQILGTLVLGLIAAGGVAAWAFYENWDWWPAIVPVALSVPALLLLLTNQVQTYFEHHPRRLSTDELASLLIEWLTADGYTVSRDKEDDESHFTLVAAMEPSDEQKIVIHRFKNDAPPIQLSASMRFADDRLQTLSILDRSRLAFDLQIEMARLGLSFLGLGYPFDSIEIWKSYTVRVMYGGRVMSQKNFMEEVQILRRASLIIRHMVSGQVLSPR